MSGIKQCEIFAGGEGDQYFRRNTDLYTNADQARHLNVATQLYAKYVAPGANVLEIGSSTGLNLAAICRATKAKGVGIDPSREAIATGSRIFPDLALSVGSAEKLDFPDNSFDFILFGFCLYVVDREHISKVVAEADRCLRDGGYIGITDFSPDVPTAREYRHHEGVTSYKMNYAGLFTVFPHFQLVEQVPFTHENEGFADEPQNRLTAQVIRKQMSGGYQRI